MDNKVVLELQSFKLQREGKKLLEVERLRLCAGEHLAVIGPSGTGKTSLLLALLGKLPFSGIIRLDDVAKPLAFVAQVHQFKTRAGTSDMYYQQRYHAQDADDAQTVAEYLGADANGDYKVPGIDALLHRSLLQLSNGEHRKVQLAKALSAAPRLLLLDQPFIGLDTEARAWLHQQLNAIAASGVQIIITTSSAEIPDCITHVLQLQINRSAQWLHRNDFLAESQNQEKALYYIPDGFGTKTNSSSSGEVLVQLDDITVRYGEKTVLQNLRWSVMRGERWLIHGANGAGKSTLLSLLTADHPQAYANKVILFGKPRGSGESIWDIKRRIGFVAPELQMYFQKTSTCFETVASGLFDTIGLFRTIHKNDEARVMEWLNAFNLSNCATKQFSSFSTGQQRLILLLRALIKNPPLLILDEPCQGLDDDQTSMFLQLIDDVVTSGNKTLIFVTHYQQQRPACITRALHLKNGVALVEELV